MLSFSYFTTNVLLLIKSQSVTSLAKRKRIYYHNLHKNLAESAGIVENTECISVKCPDYDIKQPYKQMKNVWFNLLVMLSNN